MEEEDFGAAERRENLFDVYKDTVKDIRYIIRQYGGNNPSETIECISKLVNNPKLLKSKTH